MGIKNPLAQFEIKPIIPLEFQGYDISFTNASSFMLLAVILISSYFLVAMRSQKMIPSRLQASAELLYLFAANTARDTIGMEGKKFFPFIITLFLFILTLNLFGMIPGGFTVTSHIVINMALAATVFCIVVLTAIIRHGFGFLSFFLPAGTPLILAPLMIVIELFSFLSRPFSLSIRLTANMIAGHILLKIVAGFCVMAGIILGFGPLIFIIVFTGFEIFVAILQAYIFTILTCVYINDALHAH